MGVQGAHLEREKSARYADGPQEAVCRCWCHGVGSAAPAPPWEAGQEGLRWHVVALGVRGRLSPVRVLFVHPCPVGLETELTCLVHKLTPAVCPDVAGREGCSPCPQRGDGLACQGDRPVRPSCPEWGLGMGLGSCGPRTCREGPEVE